MWLLGASLTVLAARGVADCEGQGGNRPAPSSEELKGEPALKGSLVIVGGGGMPDAVRHKFIELAGGESAKLVVIPTASEDADKGGAELEEFLAPWKKAGVESVSLLHTRSRAKADEPGFRTPIDEATGVWFSGGDQSCVTDAYLGTGVEEALRRLLDRGGVIGGTSAGAAIQSRVMITGGTETATIGTGLGFLPGVVVDQHALARSRVNRLLSVLTRYPERTGLAIDEGTALVVQKDRWEVLGRSYVVLCQLRGEGKPPRFESFESGRKGTVAGWKAERRNVVED